MPDLIAGPCADCGTETERDRVPDGEFGASWLNKMDLLCDPCSNERSEEADLQQAEDDRRRRQARLEDQLMFSGLPKAYYGWTLEMLDGPEQATAVHAAQRWAAGEIHGLVLTGPYGVGKSTIAAAAAKRYMADQNKALRWLKVHAIINDLGRGFGHPQRDAMLDALSSNSALVLDDLDKTRPTEHAVGPLFTAIDECVSELRPLIVTTNLSLGDLARKWTDSYGEAIASRLAGYCETHMVTGIDRRLAA